MRKFANLIILSFKFYKSNIKKSVLFYFIFVCISLICITTSSFSNGINNYLYVDNSVDNRILELEQPKKINKTIIDLYKKYNNATLTSKQLIECSDISKGVYGHCKLDSSTYAYFSFFGETVIDTEFDTFDKYSSSYNNIEQFEKNSNEFQCIVYDNKYMNIGILSVPIYSNETKEILDTVNLKIIDNKMKDSSNCYSLNFGNYLVKNFDGYSLSNIRYTFSFESVYDSMDFYEKLIKLDSRLDSQIKFEARELSKFNKNVKQIGTILYTLSIIVGLSLLVSFINMFVIMFIDKRKNISLLKAEGLTSKELRFILIMPLFIFLILSCLTSIILSNKLVPLICKELIKLFSNGMINSTIIIKPNMMILLLFPFVSAILIGLPCILYILHASKKEFLQLLND